jgi:hypothetical protein
MKIAKELQDTQRKVRGIVADLARAGYSPDEITVLVQRHVAEFNQLG